MIRACMTCIVIPIFLFVVPYIAAQENGFTSLEGPYLGQEPPGTTPEYFAPGVISVEENFEHSAAVFPPNGSEVFWCSNVDWYTQKGKKNMLRLYYMRQVDGTWTAPR